MTKVVSRACALLSVSAFLSVLLVISILLALAVLTPPVGAATFNYLRSPTVTIAAGGSHTVVLRANGRLQAWGLNTSGQLGDGTTTQRTSPTWVGSDTDWVSVACGSFHTVAIKANGSLYAWGQNADGQLGVGDTTGRSSPTRVGTANDWVAVACGSFHTVALKANGTVWAWGDNAYGQLGVDDTTDRTAPVQVGGGTNWSFIAAGGWHTLAIKATGQLFAWGRNDYGQLGDGAGVEWHHPIRMTDYTNWIVVAGGAFHSVGLRADGSLYAWGRNNFGQLGLGNTTDVNVPTRVGAANDWVGVACGFQHTLGIKANATVYGWGFNDHGQVGDASTTTRTSPVQVGAETTWTSLAGGGNHSVALVADGGTRAWGLNTNGQVGDGTTTTRTSPAVVLSKGCVWAAPRAQRGGTDRVASGYLHSLVVRSDGSLFSWGDGANGQVGDGALTDRPSPVSLEPLWGWRSVAVGAHFCVALRHGGSLYAWGANNYGQLGLGGVNLDKTTPQRVGSANDWVAAAAGYYHTVALRANGTLWSWGYNYDGQLGLGHRTDTNTPTQVGSASDWVAVGAAGYASYGIKADGSLYAWGNNSFGQLGLGDQTLRTSPVRVGSANTWVAVSGGVNHVLGLTVAGEAFAWGSNLEGQLGTGEGTLKTTPTAVSPATGWARTGAGSFHSGGVKCDGSLYAWGFNTTGQLGDASLTDRSLPTLIGTGYAAVAGGLRHSLLTKSTGDVYATGGNASGQLGWGTPGETTSPVFVVRLSDWIPANVTDLTSPSHPVETNWYSDPTVDLQWTASDDTGLYGFSFEFAAAPTIPDLWIDLPAGATMLTSTALADGVSYFTIRARDAGASWSAPALRAIRVDTTPPSGVGAVTSPTHPVPTTWYRDPTVTFTWSAASDATSGVAGYSWLAAKTASADPDGTIDGTGTTATLALGGGVWDFLVRAVDAAGNVGPTSRCGVWIDTTPPSTTSDADALWHPTPVTVTLTGNDGAAECSGVAYVRYRVDGGDWTTAWATGTQVTLRTGKRGGNSGVHTIEYFAADKAGNEGAVQSCQVKLDAKPPVTWDDAPLVPTVGPVTVHLTATDAHSGVDCTVCSLDGGIPGIGTTIEVSSPGEHTIRYYSMDRAGNPGVPRYRTFTVLPAPSPTRYRVVPSVRSR